MHRAGSLLIYLAILFIAFGFVLRIFGGATVSTVMPSNWIIMTTFFLALFLGFGKRRSEIYVYHSKDFTSQREVLKQYSCEMLDQILSSIMAITILCYSLYASTDYVKLRFGTDHLVYTVPFVVFGRFRYFQLLHLKGKGEDPVEMLIKDKITLINVCLWALTCVLIIY